MKTNTDMATPVEIENFIARLYNSGVSENRIVDSFSRPVGVSLIPAGKIQLEARTAFIEAEREIETAWEVFSNKKFHWTTTPNKRKAEISRLKKNLEVAYQSLVTARHRVIVSEQTSEWGIYRGNRYRNSYAYVQDGPVELDFLPEVQSCERWSDKVYKL